jgi:hypothetical protein
LARFSWKSNSQLALLSCTLALRSAAGRETSLNQAKTSFDQEHDGIVDLSGLQIPFLVHNLRREKWKGLQCRFLPRI